MQQEVEADLAQRGFCLVRDVTLEAYLSLTASLGEVVAADDIELRPGVGSYACSPGPVPFHTDHPSVDVAAWRCVRQDPEDGASLLVDTRPLVEELRVEERALLESFRLAFPPLVAGASPGFAPALAAEGPTFAVYFPPVVRPEDPDPAAMVVFTRWARRIGEEGRSTPLRIRLAVNDALFIDNRRMLHGRSTLRPES